MQTKNRYIKWVEEASDKLICKLDTLQEEADLEVPRNEVEETKVRSLEGLAQIKERSNASIGEL